MLTFAKFHQVRSSAQKVRIIANLIRGKKVSIALKILLGIQKKASFILIKLLNSAIANADHNHGVSLNFLKISSIYVNDGPMMKRMFPRAKGRSDRILKRTSHITIQLSHINNSGVI